MKTVVAIGRATALDSRFNRAGAQPMPGHHVADCRARLGPVKALRRSAALRPRFAGLTALTAGLGRAPLGHLRDGRLQFPIIVCPRHKRGVRI